MSKKTQFAVESLEQRALLAADVGVDEQLQSGGEQTPNEVAPIDGVGNNVENPELGSTDTQLLRLTTAEYADGVSAPAGEDRPSAREVSNAVVAQTESVINDRYLTDLTWLWGQFIDHDIDLTESANPLEEFNIEVPTGDPFFDPDGSGDDVIDLNRSVYDVTTGDEAGDPRQQINQITAFLDGSVVYGSDHERADALRSFEGGRLLTSEGDLLPFNTAGLENANPGFPDDALFLAGDVRANENAALTSMHTLWVREHNRIADEIALADPSLSDEQIYQQARAIVTAEIQAITYNEFLPALLGFDAISEYAGYDASVDPSIANVFSTAAYRFGHSMLSSELLRLNNDGAVIDAGNLDLSSAFFAPQEVTANGIDSLLLGAASQQAQEIDNMIIDDVRNFLFGQPGAGGFDLASLNIQRGRDHGLADYNQARVDLGLAPVTSFSEITSDPELAAELEALYGDVDNIDVWVGGLAEDHLPGSSMGELFTTVIADQFERIRDGDRFWYENTFSGQQLREIENTTLADVIERNTDITGLRENVFFDESVLYYEAGGRRGGDDVTVEVNDQTVEIISNGRVVETRAVADVNQVMIVGSDSGRGDVNVDVQSTGGELAGGIVAYGGAGGGNTLTISGTRDADEIVVDGRTVTINGITMDQTEFEAIRILASRIDDVQIIDDGGSEVTIVDDAGGRRDRGGGGRGRGGRRDAGSAQPAPDSNRFAAQSRDGDRARDALLASLPGDEVDSTLDGAIDSISSDVARRQRG